MNIFPIIMIICCLSLFSAFIFKDISSICLILIGSLVIYLSGLVFALKSDKDIITKVYKSKTHNA